MVGNIINNIQSQNQMNDQMLNLNNASKDTKLAFGIASGANVAGQGKVDDQTVNYVYNRYIEMLQQDKNATIESILREEPMASQIQAQLMVGAGGKVISGYTERDIEQAVVDKIYQEEETQDIQDMIAKFYNKFDELHEQSIH